MSENPNDELNDELTTWYEYRVRVLINHECDALKQDKVISDMQTDWLAARGQVIDLANHLREQGYTVDIQARPYYAVGANKQDKLP